MADSRQERLMITALTRLITPSIAPHSCCSIELANASGRRYQFIDLGEMSSLVCRNILEWVPCITMITAGLFCLNQGSNPDILMRVLHTRPSVFTNLGEQWFWIDPSWIKPVKPWLNTFRIYGLIIATIPTYEVINWGKTHRTMNFEKCFMLYCKNVLNGSWACLLRKPCDTHEIIYIIKEAVL